MQEKLKKLLVAMTIDVSLKNDSFYSDRFDKYVKVRNLKFSCLLFLLSAVFTF